MLSNFEVIANLATKAGRYEKQLAESSKESEGKTKILMHYQEVHDSDVKTIREKDDEIACFQDDLNRSERLVETERNKLDEAAHEKRPI